MTDIFLKWERVIDYRQDMKEEMKTGEAQVEVERRKKGISWAPFSRWKQRRSRGSLFSVFNVRTVHVFVTNLLLRLWRPTQVYFLPNLNVFLNLTKVFSVPKPKQTKGKIQLVCAFCRNVIMTFILKIVLRNVNNLKYTKMWFIFSVWCFCVVCSEGWVCSSFVSSRHRCRGAKSWAKT